MFKQKLLQQEQGFTLVEVLVSIIIVTIFVAVSMQAMVIAAVFKVRAKQYSEATTWIQEDMENVKYRAAQVNYTTLKTDAGTASNVLQVSSIIGFAVGDTLIVGTDTTNNVISSIDESALTLRINPALGGTTTQTAGVAVISNNQCRAGSSSAGFANSLKQKLPAVPSSTDNSSTPNSGIKTIAGKSFTLTRTFNIKDVTPEVLELTYNVTPSSGSAVATIYIEVIPNVALLCS